MIRTIIVDDEEHSYNDLKGMLESFYSDINIIAISTNMSEAEMAINKLTCLLVYRSTYILTLQVVV